MATADFPATITDKLFDAVPRKSTTLSSDITNSVTTIPVGSTAGFPSEGYVVIENETIYYTGTTATTFTGCTRGFAGTAVAHLATVAVRYAVVAEWANQVNAEIEAIETALGANLANAYNYGKNLIQHSAFWDINNDDLPVMWELSGTPTLAIATDTLFPSRGGKQITITGNGAALEGIEITGGTSNWLKVLPSTTYTFSIDYKVTAGDTGTLKIYSYNGAVEGTAHVNSAVFTATSATKYSVTFTTDADATNLEIQLLATADGDVCVFSHPKLEQGAIATPYILNEAEEQANIIQYYKPFCRVLLSGNQTAVPNATETAVQFDTVDYDLGSNFNTGTYTFTIPITGKYSHNLSLYVVNVDDGKYASLFLKAGATSKGFGAAYSSVANGDLTPKSSDSRFYNKDDAITVKIYHNNGDNAPYISNSDVGTYLEIELTTLDI